MNQRLAAMRANYGSVGGPLLASIESDHNTIALAVRKTQATQAEKDAWKGFIKAYGNLSKVNAKSGFTGYKSGTGGVATGFDRFVGSNTIIGLSVGVSQTLRLDSFRFRWHC